jgi:hypothetical protein
VTVFDHVVAGRARGRERSQQSHLLHGKSP